MASPKETQKALMHRLGLELATECAMRPDTPNLVGVDATMPYHRIANPTPAEHLARWVKERQYEEQRPFLPHWSGILGGLLEGHYHTRKEIALAHGKPTRWVTAMLKVVVKQGGMSEAELKSCFKRETTQYNPQLTARRGPSPQPQPCREQFEKVFAEYGLSFDLVVALLRAGAWGQVQELASDFHRGAAFTTTLRTFLTREGAMTTEQWSNCFKPVDWRRLSEKYPQARAGELLCR